MLLSDAINKVKTSETERNNVVASIFNDRDLKALICNYITKHGGNNDDGLFIFDEVIVQFIKTAFASKEKEFSGELNAYLMGICHHLWYHESKKKKKIAFTEQMKEQSEEAYEEIYLTRERYKMLDKVLEKLRSNCRAVLMHWANGYSMKEIAEKLNYLSEGMARKKKSQCFAELNDFLINNPHIKIQLQ